MIKQELKRWALFALFLVICVLWLCTIIIPISDAIKFGNLEYPFIGRIYEKIVDFIPGKIRVLEYKDYYEVQVKYFLFWIEERTFDKANEHTNSNYEPMKELRYSYTQISKREKSGIDYKIITIPEQTELHKAINGEDDEK